MNAATLLWGVLFGSIGLGYLVYGHRQRMPVPWLCGLALIALPYLVGSALWLVVLGVALMALPYFLRI